MQSSRAPPRARIGGLCLPLNSRKPGREVAAAGETRRGEPGDVELGFRGLSFPLGRMGTGAGSAAGLGPAGPARLRISTWELHARARGRIVAPGVRSARSPTQPHPWDAGTTGCPGPAPSASISTSAQWGRGLRSSKPRHLAYRAGVPGDRGVVLGGAAGGVWQEAWPCCLVTREVGHCCSEICVRLGHQATTPRARQPRSLALSLDA